MIATADLLLGLIMIYFSFSIVILYLCNAILIAANTIFRIHKMLKHFVISIPYFKITGDNSVGHCSTIFLRFEDVSVALISLIHHRTVLQ